MIPDPNDEILAIKRRLAAQFDNDVHRIAAGSANVKITVGWCRFHLAAAHQARRTMP